MSIYLFLYPLNISSTFSIIVPFFSRFSHLSLLHPRCKGSTDPQRSSNFAGMFSKMPHTPITVITAFTLIGRVVSQDPPPTIHDRACYMPGTVNAPVADCQSAINKLISQTAVIDGPTTSCLETAWSGNCGINLCSNANVRPQAIAATAQDILSGCRSSGRGSTVGGRTSPTHSFFVQADRGHRDNVSVILCCPRKDNADLEKYNRIHDDERVWTIVDRRLNWREWTRDFD